MTSHTSLIESSKSKLAEARGMARYFSETLCGAVSYALPQGELVKRRAALLLAVQAHRRVRPTPSHHLHVRRSPLLIHLKKHEQARARAILGIRSFDG